MTTVDAEPEASEMIAVARAWDRGPLPLTAVRSMVLSRVLPAPDKPVR